MSVTTRQDLYEEIWTDPVTIVAKRYGLSDVGLAKLCRRMGIPIPPRGYWARLRSGAKVRKARLPTKGRFLTTVHLTRFDPDVIAANEEAKRQKEVLREEIIRGAASAKRYEMHPLVAATKKRMVQFKEEARNPRRVNGLLDVRVSKGAFDRALRLFNAIIQEMIVLGAAVRVNDETHETLFSFKGIEFQVSIAEHFKRIGHQETDEERERRLHPKRDPFFGLPYPPDSPTYDYVPSGVLTVTAGGWRSKVWKDSASKPLEERVQDVIVGLAILASDIRKQEDQRAEDERIVELEQARYEEIRATRTAERKRLMAVETEASEWERAGRLRRYASAAEAKAKASGANGLTIEIMEWLNWVRAKADWIDPLVSASDPILDAPEPKDPGWHVDFEEE